MAQSMGAGTVWLMFSIFASIVSNYVLHSGVAHILGADSYGIFGVLLSLYLINDAVLNVGIPRAVSKFISEASSSFWSIVKTSWKIQMSLSLLFAAIYILFAPVISSLLKDASLSRYILFLGIMVVPLSIFSLLLSGYLNGLRLFKEQALIKASFPVLRTLLALLFVWLGLGIWGILLAYFFSIMLGIGMCYCFIWKKKEKKQTISMGAAPLLKFAFPLMMAVLGMALLRNINILFIKSFLAENSVVALYTAAFTLSNVSYLIFTALPLTITPVVSKAIAEKNFSLVQKYISSSFRYALLLLLPISAIVAATASRLLGVLYPPEYMVAGPLLAVLIFVSTFLILFYVLLSIITASGKPGMELLFSISFLILLIIFNYIFIPRYGFMGAAYAQALTAFIGFVGAFCFVSAKYGSFLHKWSVLRLVLAAATIYVIGLFWQYSGFLLVINYVGLFLLYLVLLYLFGELRREDWGLVQKVFTARI